ncbi:MAG TPA: hypothetical protein VKY36_03210 [Moheibacter sp.]|nr:hypothetical protein [Moheibacter sp.]
MNIYHQLEKSHSKENSLKIITFIGKDANKFSELMNCFFMETQDYRVPQRAAHVVSLIFDKNPELVQPYVPQLIKSLYNPELKNSLKRNILRNLQFSEIPQDEMGKLYDRVFQLVTSPNEDIAIRAFAITILYQITGFYPELKPELKSTIEFILEEPGCSPGVRSRGRKVLNELQIELKNLP